MAYEVDMRRADRFGYRRHLPGQHRQVERGAVVRLLARTGIVQRHHGAASDQPLDEVTTMSVSTAGSVYQKHCRPFTPHPIGHARTAQTHKATRRYFPPLLWTRNSLHARD